jgi:formiminoglutamase
VSASPLLVPAAQVAADGRPVLASLFGADYSARALTAQRSDHAPDVVRAALARFATWDSHHRTDLAAWCVADYGNAGAVRAPTWEAAVEAIDTRADAAFADDSFVVALGGDHSIAWPVVAACTEAALRRGNGEHGRVGILQLDVHHDVRSLEHGPSNGTPIRGLIESGTVRGDDVVQVGIHPFGNGRATTEYCDAVGIVRYTLDDVADRGAAAIARAALLSLDGVDAIHLTVDIDVLDRAFAPGTAAALPGGLDPRTLLQLVEAACSDPRVVSMDVMEFDPERDVASVTAYAAANVVMAALAAVARRTVRPN